MDSLQEGRQLALSAAMRRAEEGLRVAGLRGTTPGTRGTALHSNHPLMLSQPSLQAPPVPSTIMGEDALGIKRQQWDEQAHSLDLELDGLELAITQLREKPTLATAKFVRERKTVKIVFKVIQ